MDSAVIMPAATAHFSKIKAEKDAARAEAIEIAKANAPIATRHFGAKKAEKDARIAAEVEAAKANAPAATKHFGRLAAEKKAEREARIAEEIAKYQQPVAPAYFNAKMAEGSHRRVLSLPLSAF